MENPRAIIVSGSDSGYFWLLKGLVQSLQAGPFARRLALGVFDLGLTAEERAWLEAQGATLATPAWEVDFPGRERAPGFFRGFFARPFLPRYFPGHDIYVWLDGDTWVQDDSVLPWYLHAAASGRLAMVPEADRSYWTSFKPPKLWGQNQKCFAWGFGLKAGYRLGRNPILNAGTFALAADAPHWQRWAETHRRMLNRRRAPWHGDIAKDFAFFLSDQTALNHVAFGQRQKHTLLPALANWFCGKGTPMWDETRGMLIEPNEPYAPLGIVHLAGKGMKERIWTLDTLQGGKVTSRLTWEAVQDLRAQSSSLPSFPAVAGMTK